MRQDDAFSARSKSAQETPKPPSIVTIKDRLTLFRPISSLSFLSCCSSKLFLTVDKDIKRRQTTTTTTTGKVREEEESWRKVTKNCKLQSSNAANKFSHQTKLIKHQNYCNKHQNEISTNSCNKITTITRRQKLRLPQTLPLQQTNSSNFDFDFDFKSKSKLKSRPEQKQNKHIAPFTMRSITSWQLICLSIFHIFLLVAIVLSKHNLTQAQQIQQQQQHKQSTNNFNELKHSYVRLKRDSQQYFEVQPEVRTFALAGAKVRLRCLVRNIQGECLWLRNGKAIGNIRNKYEFKRAPEDGDCSLILHNVTVLSDDGAWQCQVTAPQIDQDTLQSREVFVVVLVAPERPSIKNLVSVLYFEC